MNETEDLVAAVESLPEPQLQALAVSLAGWRDECARVLPRVSRLWSALLCLLAAVGDHRADTLDALERDALGIVPDGATCVPDPDPGPPSVRDQLAVLDAMMDRAVRLRDAQPPPE